LNSIARHKIGESKCSDYVCIKVVSMKFERQGISDAELRALYKELVFPRLIEEKMLVLLRQGKISKWFSGIGQEAISVGAAMALQQEEYLLPMHRNLGMFTARGVPFRRLFSQWQGKENGFTKGRDRSFHFGSNEFHMVGMISHLGPQLGVAAGIALASLLDNEKKATLVVTGDGGTSEGDFHEALNVASVWDLPVIFIIESNGYGLSTPSSEQYRCAQLTDRALGYGMKSVRMDGNNILEVYSTLRSLAEELRNNPKPVLIECLTFRMRGHEEASGTKYVPKDLFEFWKEKDPIDQYGLWLHEQGIMPSKEQKEIRKELKESIDADVLAVFDEPELSGDRALSLNDVYAPHSFKSNEPQSKETKPSRMIDAVRNAMELALDKHPNLILMGQDIGVYGGVFKATEGLLESSGPERVRNTPLCESAIVSAALGLSIKGKKAMVEMQFADFVSSGFTAVVNNLAKSHWRWGQNADVVVRMPTGAGVAAGPFHSQSNEAWFFHTPGLKIYYPSNAYDAKGLLLTAFEDPNPIMFFEHKALYRAQEEQIPTGYYTIPEGKAKICAQGEKISLISYGMGVVKALECLPNFPENTIEIIDLRTLVPLDYDAVFQSVKKTGKALVLHEATDLGGIGADLAAKIQEACFQWLDAPVKRLSADDTPVPFAPNLEQSFLPWNRLQYTLEELLSW